MGLKHFFHSTKADPADPTIIGATKWNADHYYVDGAGAPIGNVGALLLAGAAGALTHLNSVAAGSVLTSAGAGSLPVWAAPATIGPSTMLQVAGLGIGRAAVPGYMILMTGGNGTIAHDLYALASLDGVNGHLTITNNSQTDFSLLQFGGTTAAFPALRRRNSVLEVMAADASAYADLFALKFILAFGTTMMSPTDGKLMLSNTAQNDFTLLQFGGTTAAFPALKRGGQNLYAYKADDSGFTILYANSFGIENVGRYDLDLNGPTGKNIRTGAGAPEGVVAASVGSLYLNISGGAATTLYVKTGGTNTNTGWTAK